MDEGGSSGPPPLPPRRKSLPPSTVGCRRPSPPSVQPPAPLATSSAWCSSPDGSRMTTAKPINLPPAEDAAPINSQQPAAAAASAACLQPPSHSSSHGKLHYNGMDATKDKPSPAKLTSGSKSENTSPATRRDKVHGLMSAGEWRETCTDTSSDIERASGSSLPKLDDHALAMVKRRVKKAINRSRSDLTKRLSNSSDLSELSARFSRNSADLEKFFNEMGLDKSVLAPMLSAHCASDCNLFESVSSLDSPDIRSLTSDDDDSTQKSDHGLKTAELHVAERPAGQTSIVERNARIIKWLCNVKKATSQEED